MRNILLLLTVLPLFMSYIVKLYALRAALGLNGLLNQALVGMGILDEPSKAFLYNQRAVLMTMTVIFLPFVILPVFISLERIPSRLLEASHDLGATPLRTFRRVVLPLSLPGTVAGALFVFVLAMGDFITPQMVGGVRVHRAADLVAIRARLQLAARVGHGRVLLATSLAVILAAATLAQVRFRAVRSPGERVVEAVAGLFTALVLLVLYSPVLINALFSTSPWTMGDSVGQLFAGAVPHGLVRSGRH